MPHTIAVSKEMCKQMVVDYANIRVKASKDKRKLNNPLSATTNQPIGRSRCALPLKTTTKMEQRKNRGI